MPKYDFAFRTPLMNAAGVLGFAPEIQGPVDLAQFGAFITHPVSLRRRTPARGRACLAYPGGFLLHTGYPNPGLKAVLSRYAAHWSRASLPVIIHLLAQDPDEVQEMVSRLEAVEGIAGVELGLPHHLDPQAASQLVVSALGELPVMVRLPLERALGLAPACIQAGAAAVSLAPPRGGLPLADGSFLEGRLHGPALFPQALSVTAALARAGLPVVSAGGIYRPQDVDAMLSAGALAVQVDSALWAGGWWKTPA